MLPVTDSPGLQGPSHHTCDEAEQIRNLYRTWSEVTLLSAHCTAQQGRLGCGSCHLMVHVLHFSPALSVSPAAQRHETVYERLPQPHPGRRLQLCG